MLLRILELGASADLIGPLLGLVQNVLNGPSHTFLVPADCGWSGREIEVLLKQHGVKPWGRLIIHRTIIFTVRIAQASWAEELLRRKGIPVLSPPVQAAARRSGSRHRQRRSGSRHRQRPVRSLLAWVDACLDKLAQALTGLFAE
jgi:hypothetical protein